MTPLETFTADHRFLLRAAAEAAGIADPVAIDFDEFLHPLLKNSRRGELLPLGGVLIRDWYRHNKRLSAGVEFGGRLYTADGIRFVRVQCTIDQNLSLDGYSFFIVDRRDYRRLFRFARQCHQLKHPLGPPPILDDDLFDILKQNTLDFLDAKNLRRIRVLGGRAKRGLLFSGPPGNGKTSACRWILQQCLDRGHEIKQITPDDYRFARNSCNPTAAVRELFTVESRGVIFFDDMDLALRDRTDDDRPEDQTVFLGAMDGIETNEGVVYVFTTNMSLDRIDPAFRRPGRLDVTLHFPKPTPSLRTRLVARWHDEIRNAIDLDQVVRETEGHSFAEIEELKNLLVLRFVDAGVWDWEWAKVHFERNRQDSSPKVTVGFATHTRCASPLHSRTAQCD